MSTTATPEATPQDGSLDAAQSAILGLLSKEDQPTEGTQPEPTPESTAPESQQAQPEPAAKAEEIEAAKSEDAAEKTETAPEQPQKFKTKVDGQDIEVTLEEALKGYSRTEDYTRKTQELAAKRREFEEKEVAAVRAERDQYTKLLTEFETALKAMTPAEPDWDRLKTELAPEAFAAEVLGWQQRQKSIEKIQAEQSRVREQQEADARKGFESYVAQEREKLEAKLPEMKDPEKAKALQKDLVEFATVELGFSPAEVQQVTDHRLVVLLNMGLQYAKAAKNKPTIQNKIDRALETPAPGSRTKPAKPDDLVAAKTRAQKTGRVEDAAAVIEKLLK